MPGKRRSRGPSSGRLDDALRALAAGLGTTGVDDVNLREVVVFDLAQQRVVDRHRGDGPRWRPEITEG